RRHRRSGCCLDGNLCRTVIIFVVQVLARLILTPLILIFINEAINPVVVAISVAFLLLLIASLVCSVVCRCLYLRRKGSAFRHRSAGLKSVAMATARPISAQLPMELHQLRSPGTCGPDTLDRVWEQDEQQARPKSAINSRVSISRH
uniref:Conserved plasma membrane protein n=1 Tax=Macrostomum lignano TaxID=282301 RepID=A0A1I8I8U6_9PLAT